VSAAEQPPEGAIQVPVVWVGADDLPVHHANQFVGVVAPGEVFLTMGTLIPPAILGETEDERRAMAEKVQFVPIQPIARIGLTPDGLKALMAILEQTLANYEKQPQQRQGR
jgi:hypothetical protein